VRERAGVDERRAETVTGATLETLAERLSGGEAADLAAQLPKSLKEYLRPSDGGEPFGLEDFKQRVAERAGLGASEVTDDIRAILTTVREAVSGGEFSDMIEQLPDEFWQLIEPTSWRGDR
jgi:uncharacterized protein (DUF2267 family)